MSRLELIDEIDTQDNKLVDNSDTNISRGIFDVLGVLFYDKPSRDVSLVQVLNNDVTLQQPI